MNLKRKIIQKIKAIFGLNILKQEAMFRLALKEEGLDYRKFNISINHVDGLNIINGITLSIIYPKSFFNKAKILHSNSKKHKFYFNGNMSNDGGRKAMLAPFANFSDTKIVESDYGRSPFTKNKFNKIYYKELSFSEFGLCPHQKDFIGNSDTMWTYRFIECCMVNTIPVIFNEAPLGKNFTSGFHFYTDDIFFKEDIQFDKQKAFENYELALNKFTLNNETIKKLKSFK
ncbi:hypothetical protein [Arcobacter porcinus]|nr:hypothetical protein [Arcobacter porcinus]OCL92390.1 hypothetical protein AAX27_01168 [Aliarcobacter thereius]